MSHEKLIRDKIPDLVRAKGETIKTRYANAQELRERFLPEKIVEEAQELAAANTIGDRVAELADLFEVLDEYMAHHGISVVRDVHPMQQKKREGRGGFNKRIILVTEGE